MIKIYALKDPETFEIKYIGQTSLSLYRRLTRHVSESLTTKEETPKRKWIRTLIQKELCPIIELLEIPDNPNEREIYWMNKYKNTILNVDKFANFYKKDSKKVFGLILETLHVLEFRNVTEASRVTGESRSNIIKAIHSNKKAKGILWSYTKDFDIKKYDRNKLIILTNTINGEKFIVRSIAHAIEVLNLNRESHKNGIKYALEHNNKEYKGYYWEYVEEHVKFGELLENPEKDNQQPSLENDIKVSKKVQRLTSEESTNNLDTSAEHQNHTTI